MNNFIMDGEIPCFYLTQRIDANSIQELSQNLIGAKNAEYKKIRITMNTGGGNVYEMATLVGVMQDLKAQGMIIETVGNGRVFSAGTLILSNGSAGNRYVYPHSQLMIHAAKYSAFDPLDEKQKKEMQAVANMQTQLYLQSTKIEENQLLKFLEEETYFTAEQAILYGFADKIIEPVAEVKGNEEVKPNNKNKKMDDLEKVKAELKSDFAAQLEAMNQMQKLKEAEASKNAEIVMEARNAEILSMANDLFLDLGLTEGQKSTIIKIGKNESIAEMVKVAKELAPKKAPLLQPQIDPIPKGEPVSLLEKSIAGDYERKSIFDEDFNKATDADIKEYIQNNPKHFLLKITKK